MFDFEDKMNFYEDKINAALGEEIGDSLSTVFLDLLTNICNFDCTFCDAKKLFNVKDNSFSNSRLDEMALELKELNVDSVLLVGEGGEPIIHPYFNEFSNKLLELNIKLGIYTNGSIPKKSIIKTLSNFEFVRISLNAGTQKSHKIIHQYKGNLIFDKVLKFIQECRNANTKSVGVSFVLLKENIDELYQAAILAKENGAHFIEFKPAYGHNYAIDQELYIKNLKGILSQLNEAEHLEDENFKVVLNNQLKIILRKDFNQHVDEMTILKTGRICITSKLRMVVSPSSCYLYTPHRSKKNYSYGDPKKESLVSIWNSLKHKELLNKECFLKCAYHNQNEALLKLYNSKGRFKSKSLDIEQKSFL
ncbi:MAG: radical SAM protein [Chitinophagales bacterium]|nr:radical SAM protein [Chitinophagales bacterium]